MSRRGLTLIEVLASIVILTMLAVVCMPMLQAAETSSQAQLDERLLVDLGNLADALIESPREFGIDDLSAIDTIELAWPEIIIIDEPTRDPVSLQLRCVGDGEGGIAHAWAIFRTEGGIAICRWIGPEPFKNDAPEEGP